MVHSIRTDREDDDDVEGLTPESSAPSSAARVSANPSRTSSAAWMGSVRREEG